MKIDQAVDKVLVAVDKDLEGSIARLFDFLRIASISTDPHYKSDCQTAAHWITTELNQIGFKAELRETAGHPMVVAHYLPPDAGKNFPHVLFYGHYDVQPVDPVNLWDSPPFEPVRKRGKDGVDRMFARGVADDKGQLMTFVEAFRAMINETGTLPIKATILLEGEEECGSPSLVPFLKANKQELSCDAAFVCDTGMWDAKTPAITTRLRGMVHEEVTVTGPSIDLHSGMYGGPATNPLKVLSRLVANLHDKTGRVTVPRFYDGVAPLPKETRRKWQALKFNDKRFMATVGLKAAAGEKGFTPLEQIWARPTAEVNGMWGGYTAAGSKTVIPSKAHAKFTFRLVGKQNPQRILKAFQAWAKKQMPKDATIEFSGRGGGAPASEIGEKSPYLTRSAAALKAEFRREAALVGSGGSIPIVRHFKDILGMDSVLIGFGLSDDAIHSPNEKYNVSSFHRGIRSWVRVIAAIAE